jgi:hypothetical protein
MEDFYLCIANDNLNHYASMELVKEWQTITHEVKSESDFSQHLEDMSHHLHL